MPPRLRHWTLQVRCPRRDQMLPNEDAGSGTFDSALDQHPGPAPTTVDMMGPWLSRGRSNAIQVVVVSRRLHVTSSRWFSPIRGCTSVYDMMGPATACGISLFPLSLSLTTEMEWNACRPSWSEHVGWWNHGASCISNIVILVLFVPDSGIVRVAEGGYQSR